MHDIWNPWHGCHKISEGCQNCYMYVLDGRHDKNGMDIYKTKHMNYPLQKNRDGTYKIKSGEMIRVCMTSDFFLEEADKWREEAWRVIRKRRDVIFFLLTKRADRIQKCLPEDWKEGYENVFLNVTCENQKRADERIPILLKIPAKHKGVMCAPLIGEIDLSYYLNLGVIERVVVGGENYEGFRPCNYDHVKKIHQECLKNNVSFSFIETGTIFIKDGIRYRITSKEEQSKIANKANLNFEVKVNWKLYDLFDQEIPEERLYKKQFRERCLKCGSKLICNGCADCGKCKDPILKNINI